MKYLSFIGLGFIALSPMANAENNAPKEIEEVLGIKSLKFRLGTDIYEHLHPEVIKKLDYNKITRKCATELLSGFSTMDWGIVMVPNLVRVVTEEWVIVKASLQHFHRREPHQSS